MTTVASVNQTALLEIGGMTPEILLITNIAVSDAYSKSYAYVYYFAVAIGGLAIIASLCMRDFDKYLNTHVSRQLYHKKSAHTDPLEHVDLSHESRQVSEEGEKTVVQV
jgi:hypothetical protein